MSSDDAYEGGVTGWTNQQCALAEHAANGKAYLVILYLQNRGDWCCTSGRSVCAHTHRVKNLIFTCQIGLTTLHLLTCKKVTPINHWLVFILQTHTHTNTPTLTHTHTHTHTYHEGNVNVSDQVHLGVAGRLLRDEDEGFGVQGEQLGAVLQERDIFPGPVLPVVDEGFAFTPQGTVPSSTEDLAQACPVLMWLTAV